MKISLKFKIGIIAFVIVSIVSYFFLLPFDYKISFKTNNAPWLIYHFVSEDKENIQWNEEHTNILRFQYNELENSDYTLKWDVAAKTNELTKVDVKMQFLKNRFIEKLKILVGQSGSVNKVITEIKEFNGTLIRDSKKYRWESIKENKFGKTRCLCAPITSKISEKADKMNRHIDFIASYLPKGKKGYPMIYINSMDMKTQSINFDFCFPLPKDFNIDLETEEYVIKEKPHVIGYSQAFYGNFSQTYRGWFKAIEKLGYLNKKIQFPIVEVFYDSPFSGTSDTEWKSILYISSTELN